MKIKIKKANGRSQVFLDGKPVPSCLGYEIVSKGGTGYITVQLTILADTLDMESETKELPEGNQV